MTLLQAAVHPMGSVAVLLFMCDIGLSLQHADKIDAYEAAHGK